MISVTVGSSLREFTGGDARFEVDASTVKGLIAVLEARYPGIAAHLTDGSSIAINGEILIDALYEDIPDGADVHFVPAIGGG